MKMIRPPARLALFASLLLWYAVPVRAQWTGSGTGVQQYLTTSNWAGGTINDTFLNVTNNGLDLRFSGNHTTTGTWNLGFNINQNVTLQSDSATVRTITLGGNIDPRPNNLAQSSFTFANTLILDLNGNRTFFTPNTRAYTFQSKITGNGQLTIGPTNNGGAGAVTLSNPANDWTGDTVVVSQGGNGGLVIGANEVIPHGVGKGSFILNHQMSFAGNADETVNNLSGASAASEITTSGGINTLTVLSLVNSTYAGRIRGNNSSSGQGNRKIELFKEGNATLTLTNSNNNYVGQTQINAGTLLVNGSLSMIGETGDANPAAVALPVTVNANGTLGGTGTINRPVTLAGGTLSPGASAGQITIGNNLSGNGSYLWEMGTLHDQSSGTAGTNWDLVQLTDGTATLGGMLVDLDFSLLGANGPSSANPFWNTDHQWKILDLINTASLGSTFSGINPSDILTPRGSFSLSLGSGPNANDAFLNFTAATAGAVPEPASIAVWSLLGLALASYGVARRRRAAR